MARCCSFCGKILPEVGQCDCPDSKAYFEQMIREESHLSYQKEKTAWTAVKIASIVLGMVSLILVCFAPLITFFTAAAGVVLGTCSVRRSCRRYSLAGIGVACCFISLIPATVVFVCSGGFAL